MPLTIVTPPAVEPVSVAEFRRDRRLDALADDDTTSTEYLDSLRYVQAAVGAVEEYTRRALVVRTLKLTVSGLAGRLAAPLRLLRPPIIAVDSVTVDGAAVAAGDGYVWDTALDTIAPAAWVPRYGYWPDAASIVVTYRAGYGAPADVPAPLRQAVLRIAGDLWEQREDHVVGTVIGKYLPHDAKSLMDPYRVVYL